MFSELPRFQWILNDGERARLKIVFHDGEEDDYAIFRKSENFVLSSDEDDNEDECNYSGNLQIESGKNSTVIPSFIKSLP